LRGKIKIFYDLFVLEINENKKLNCDYNRLIHNYEIRDEEQIQIIADKNA